jgi:beta-phosphoglucomutase-like phosphatase (HAD superfamily)
MIKVEDKIKALIFDCDGTLVDSMPLHFEAWRETFEQYGREYPHDFIDSRKGMPVDEVLRHYNEHYGDNLNVESFVKTREDKALERLRSVQAVDIVVDIVHRYKGVLPMAVCSGSLRKSVMISLESIGLSDVFKEIITTDDNFPPKPAPDMFFEAARRLNVKAHDCQVFEDSDTGIQAALSAGMVATDIRKYL